MSTGVGAVSASSLLAYAQSVVQSSSAAGPKAGGSAASASGNVPGDQAEISGTGKLLSELQELEFQHPPLFKSMALELSHMLSDASQQVTGSQSQLLSNLAAKLQTAADTGSLDGVLA